MTETPAPAPDTATVTFTTPVVRGVNTIDGIDLKKPRPGQLRGVTIVDLLQMDVSAVAKVAPRISNPPITEAEALNLDAGDFTEVATAISGFLLPTRLKADFPTT